MKKLISFLVVGLFFHGFTVTADDHQMTEEEGMAQHQGRTGAKAPAKKPQAKAAVKGYSKQPAKSAARTAAPAKTTENTAAPAQDEEMDDFEAEE